MKKVTFLFPSIKDLYDFLDVRTPKNVDIKVAIKQVKCLCGEEDILVATQKYKASYCEGWLKLTSQNLRLSNMGTN